MKDELISIIMPVYNNQRFLPEAIESILNQTYVNFEFIIIDDCSTDGSWEIITSYAKKDNRIKPFRNKNNLKIVKTRNKGFKLAKGSYFAIFDSDDISQQERLEKQIKFLKNNGKYGVVGSHTIIIDEFSKEIGRRRYLLTHEQIMKTILLRSPLAQPSVMIKREVIESIGDYSTDGKFDRSRDYDLWVRISERYKIGNLNDYLLKYRVSSTQGKTTHLRETIKSTMQIQKKWLFKKGYFSFMASLNFVAEWFLLFLPNSFILWLFKKVNYK